MTDHHIRASFHGEGAAGLGSPAPGGIQGLPERPSLMHLVPAVAEALRQTPQVACRDAFELLALQILTAIDIVARESIAGQAKVRAEFERARNNAIEKAATAKLEAAGDRPETVVPPAPPVPADEQSEDKPQE